MKLIESIDRLDSKLFFILLCSIRIRSRKWDIFKMKLTLAVVDANNGSDHFWNNDDITEMGLDTGRLLTNLTSHGFLGLNHIINKRPTYWYVIIAELDNSTPLNLFPISGVIQMNDLSRLESSSDLLKDVLYWNYNKIKPCEDAWGSSPLGV